MKPLPFSALAVPALAATLALTGCTVHNHYYGVAGPTSPGTVTVPADAPGRAVLADQLAGVHTAIEVTATNLANANTTGYKARRVTFIEGQTRPYITTDWTVGSPQITDRPLDLYIQGDGFFRVDTLEDLGNGVAYTRRGNFFVNRDGDLVLGHADGPRLSDGINISGDVKGITISADGEVSVVRPDNTYTNVGTICLYTFLAPDGLEPLGQGLFAETGSSGPAWQETPGHGRSGRLAQGMLENSNVPVIATWVQLKKLGHWADAIAEEIGLSESQRRALNTSPEDLALDEVSRTSNAGFKATRDGFEDLIRQQTLRDGDFGLVTAGLQVDLDPNRRDTHHDFRTLLQAEFDTMSSHDQ